MQEDVFRGLGDWRQEALPDDMAKWRDLNLHEPGYKTLLYREDTSVRTVLAPS